MPSTLPSNSSTWPSGQATHSTETKCALRCAGVKASRSRKHPFDLLHGVAEIFLLARPARRIDARRAVERIDRKPGIVRERRKSGGLRRRFRLDAGIRREGRAGFFRLGQVQVARRYGLDAVGREQLAHLGELARIVGGDDERGR